MIKTESLENGAVLRIVLDQPKANVLERRMIDVIGRALETETSPRTKLILFEGAGAHFSFGASVKEHQRDEAAGMLATFHQLFRQLARLCIPTCALVRGQCLGGGLELASWCTYVLASPEAQLGQPEIRLAVFPPMASILLPWRAGARAAMDLCVSGRSVGAEEAWRLGVVNEVTADLEAAWRARYEESLRPTSASSLRHAERAVRAELLHRMERDLPRLERSYLEELMTTHDANEGITAFLERRAPQFQDC